MLTMATRGPGPREKARLAIAQALTNTMDDTRDGIAQAVANGQFDPGLAQKQLQELQQLEVLYSEEHPPIINEIIGTPFLSVRTVELVYSMAWHLVPAPTGQYFVTSDWPAHFFDNYGLGNKESEFTFPISKSLALVGERRRRLATTYEEAQERVLKEVNKRMISHATRFVFSPKPGDWIATVAAKTNRQLDLIRWKYKRPR